MTKKNFFITYIIIALLILLDQVSKVLILTNFKIEGTEIPVIKDFFAIVLVYNTGAAWGIGGDSTLILAIISLVAGLVAVYFSSKNDFRCKKIYSIALCLIVAGAFGNCIDRFLTVANVLEGVIDFFSFTFGSYEFPVFNIADMCLVIGVVLLVIDVIFLEERRKKNA